MKALHGKFWLLVFALVTALTFPAGATTVTATLDPPDIALGDAAQLTVTVTGSQSQAALPDIPGLQITAVGQSSQFELNNGSLSVNASTTYSVVAQHNGNFTIPAITVNGASSKPITLHVGRGNGGTTSQQALPLPNVSPMANSGPVVMPAPGAGPNADQPAPAQPRYGWIQVTLPKKELFVGELVPVDIKAYIDDAQAAQIVDLPQFTSDALTLGALGKNPDVNAEAVNGGNYHTYTWHSSLVAAKPGNYAMSLKMPLVVVVPMQVPQANGGAFDAFFRDAFASMGQRKEVVIKNGDDALKVLPLPQENRPADFAGAVGQFVIEASASPVSVNAGDPITYRLKVTGKGNFDRVSSNVLAADSNWKTYPPKNSFEPADSVGYAGAKTFEQPIIPMDSSITSIPAVNFSFFNPETRQYVTRSTAPIAVTVTGSSRSPAMGSPVASTNSQPIAPTSTQSAAPTPGGPGTELVMNKIEPGTFFATLRPVYLSPVFLAGQAVPLLALFAGMFFVRRQRRGVDQAKLRANAANLAIRQQIEAMDEAMKNHRTGAFFISARGALQQRFGQQWNMRPETITMADVYARLGDESQKIRPIFEMADQASYSELHVGDADLAQWREIIVNELAEKNS